MQRVEKDKKKKLMKSENINLQKIMHQNFYKYKFAENERKILNIKKKEI